MGASVEQLRPAETERGKIVENSVDTDTLFHTMQNQAANIVMDFASAVKTTASDLETRMHLPLTDAAAAQLSSLVAEAGDAKNELVSTLQLARLNTNVELVGQMITEPYGQRYMSGTDLLTEIAVLPDTADRHRLFQRVAELDPEDVLHNLKKLDQATTRFVRPTLIAALLKKDPLLAVKKSAIFDPPLTDAEYEQCLSATVELQPAELIATIHFKNKDDPHVAQAVAQLLRTNPAELVQQYDHIKADYDITFTEEQRAQIVLAATTQCPVQLLEHIREFNLNVDERNKAFTQALREDPHSLLNKLKQNPLFLIPPERTLLVNYYIEFSPNSLFEAFQDNLNQKLNPSECDRLFIALIKQQPKSLLTVLESHPTELRRILPILAKDSAMAAPIIQALTNRFTYSFQQDPDNAITQQINNRTLALQIYQTVSTDKQHLTRSALLEHAADSDFGDATLVKTLLEQIENPVEQAQAREQAEANQDSAAKLRYYQKIVGERSTRNTATFLERLSKNYGTETVQEQLAKIEGKTFTTINIQASQILSFLKTGRWKSTWETQYRGGGAVINATTTFTPIQASASYLRQRHSVEQALGIRAKGSLIDPHPVYGALGYENGKDEIYGAAPDYGDFFIKIKPLTINQRASVTAGDTFHEGMEATQRQFNIHDAAIARAQIDLANVAESSPEWNYVDVQILGGITLQDVESVNIPADKANQPGNQTIIQTIHEQFPHVQLNITSSSVNNH